MVLAAWARAVAELGQTCIAHKRLRLAPTALCLGLVGKPSGEVTVCHV